MQANRRALLAGALVALSDSAIPDLVIELVVYWLVLREVIRN